MRKLIILKLAGILFLYIGLSLGGSPGDVVINEIAWMGTPCSDYDDWIELYNNSLLPVDLTGWSLKAGV